MQKLTNNGNLKQMGAVQKGANPKQVHASKKPGASGCLVKPGGLIVGGLVRQNVPSP